MNSLMLLGVTTAIRECTVWERRACKDAYARGGYATNNSYSDSCHCYCTVKTQVEHRKKTTPHDLIYPGSAYERQNKIIIVIIMPKKTVIIRIVGRDSRERQCVANATDSNAFS